MLGRVVIGGGAVVFNGQIVQFRPGDVAIVIGSIAVHEHQLARFFNIRFSIIVIAEGCKIQGRQVVVAENEGNEYNRYRLGGVFWLEMMATRMKLASAVFLA